MRIIVAGSRVFDDYLLLKRTLDHLTRKLDKSLLVILSGHAKGADIMGERWCFEALVKSEIHHADWDKHGKAAGHIRNEEMVKVADSLVAFWDGKSTGTKHMIDIAKKKGLNVRVITFTPKPPEKPIKKVKGVKDENPRISK